MVITALAENNPAAGEFGFEHGLSLYLESNGRRILFDTGASGLFAENAEKLGVDLSAVELAVLSHGHYDHGGGLRDFFKRNSKAKIYARPEAFEAHYALRPDGKKRFIGLDEALMQSGRFVFTGNRYSIGDGLEVFSGVTGRRLFPSGNAVLYMKSGEEIVPDDFSHEQNLIVEENGKVYLLAGCAHNGIINIMERFFIMRGRYPDVVVGGFHLSEPASGRFESPEVLAGIAAFLLGTGAMFYTCHCTGAEPFRLLKEAMAGRIAYLPSGGKIDI